MINEPIAWIQKLSIDGLTKAKTSHYKYHCGVIQRENQEYSIPLYTQSKEWVGLTDDDRILIKHDANYNQFMTAGEYADIVQQLTEARLKDLNT